MDFFSNPGKLPWHRALIRPITSRIVIPFGTQKNFSALEGAQALHAVAAFSGFRTPAERLGDFKKLSPRKRLKIEKALTKVSLAKSSSEDFGRAMMGLYRALAEKDSLLRSFLKLRKPGEAVDSYLVRQMEEALMKDGFAKMATFLDLPSTRWGRIKQNSRAAIATTWSAALTAATAVSALHGNFRGLALPELHTVRLGPKNLQPEIWERALEHGALSVKDDLRRLFGRRAHFDVYFNAFARATMLAVLSTVLVDTAHMASDFVSAIIENERLEEEVEKNAKAIEEEVQKSVDELQGLQTHYDWSFPEAAIESLWEDQVRNAEIETGRSIDRNSPKYLQKKEEYLEEALWDHVSAEAVKIAVEAPDPISEDSLFHLLVHEFGLRRKKDFDPAQAEWIERKKAFQQALTEELWEAVQSSRYEISQTSTQKLSTEDLWKALTKKFSERVGGRVDFDSGPWAERKRQFFAGEAVPPADSP